MKSEVKRVPIVALTAYAMKGDEQKCIDAGRDDYLAKPIDRKKLFKMLEKHLSEQARSGATSLPDH